LTAQLGIEDSIAFFDAHVAHDVLKDMTQAVVDSYGRSQSFCEAEFTEKARRDVRGQLRRATIETRLEGLASKPHHRGSMLVEPRGNATQTNYHVEIQCGCVVITQSKVGGPNARLPRAKFRLSLARTAQLPLWGVQPAIPPDATLWAALIHGVRGRDQSRPDFLRIVFPLEDGSHAPGIDLFDRFPEFLHVPQTVAVEPTAALPPITIKPGARRRLNEEGTA